MSTEDRATFAVELKDETSGAAEHAASALANLKSKITEGKKALDAMRASMRAMKQGGLGASAAAKELADRITAQKTALASMNEAYIKMGGTFDGASGKTRGASGALADLLKRAQGMPGPIGAIASRLSGLVGSAGLAAGAIGLLVGAVVALSGAMAAAVVALARYGVAQSDARRSELLRLESLTTLRRWHGLVAGSASEMQSAIDRVSDSTALGRGALEQYTERLHRMGLRGDALSEALEGMAIAGSVQGERGANRFAALAASIARTGGSVRALTADYQARLGPIARRQMLALDVQTAKLRQNLDRLFSGLEIERLLEGVSSITSLFSQTTASGRALKSIVQSMLQPLIDFAAGPGALIVRRFFQGMILGALKVENVILRLRLWFRETFGPESILGRFDFEDLAFSAGINTITFLATVVAGAAGAFALLAGAIGGVVAMTVHMNTMATSLIDGLINGIERGIPRVISTVQGLADSIRGRFVSAFRIGSPSRVFEELGRQLPAGLTLGIEAGSAEAQGAVESMVSPTGALRGGGSTTNVVIEGGITVNAGSSDDPMGLAIAIRDGVIELLEGAGITMGATPEAA